MMSSTVDSSGMLMVFEMAPEINGCTAAIMRTWPMYWMARAPLAGRRLQSKTARCSGFNPGAPSMLPVASMWADDFLRLLGRITQPDERLRHRVVDDLDVPAAHQLLVLDQRQVGLDAGGVAIHHEADGAGGRDDGYLRVAVTGAPPQLVRLVPALNGALEQRRRHVGAVDAVHRAAMHADHLQERLLVARVFLEWPHRFGDARAGQVGLAAHDRGHGAGEVAALVAIVGKAERHERARPGSRNPAPAAGTCASSRRSSRSGSWRCPR